jgi:hypothetical protein
MASLFHHSEKALQSGPKETHSSACLDNVVQCWRDPRAQSSVIVLGSRGVSRGKWEWAKHISCWGTKCWRQLWLWSLSGNLYFLLTNAQVSQTVTIEYPNIEKTVSRRELVCLSTAQWTLSKSRLLLEVFMSCHFEVQVDLQPDECGRLVETPWIRWRKVMSLYLSRIEIRPFCW